jgi:Xylose isomerase-like TIM barrel
VRIEAASAAGFSGFGLLSADLPAAEREYGLSGIRAMLDDNGMVDLELEGIPYWWDDGPRRAGSDAIRHALLDAAEALGARHIKVNPDGDDAPWDPGHWAAKLAELAAQADGVGTRLGIEFFPWSNIKNLHAGLRLVEAAGHPASDPARRASSSTCGTSSGPIPRSATSHPSRCTGSSGWSSTTPTATSSGPCSRTRSTGGGTAAKVPST